MPLIDREVGAAQACWRRTARWRGARNAAAPRRLGLKNAPAIIAGVDLKIGLVEDEADVVAPDLFAGAAAKCRPSQSDALTNATGQRCSRQHAIRATGVSWPGSVTTNSCKLKVVAEI